MLIYVVSLFDVILDIPVFLARDSWNRLARPGLNAQLRRRAAVLRPRRACRSQPLAAAVTRSTYSTRTAWYRNTESDSSCSVAKFDKNWLFILSWPEGGAFADFVSTAAKSQPRPFFILMQGALSSRGILHSKLRFPFSLQFWFRPNFVTLVLAVDPPWNFLYEMGVVNPQKRNQNDIVFFFSFFWKGWVKPFCSAQKFINQTVVFFFKVPIQFWPRKL